MHRDANIVCLCIPSIRLSMNVTLTKLDVKAAADALQAACKEILH